MFSKTNIIATLVTGLWAFFGGYLLWGILGESLMMDHLGSASGVMKETPDFVHLTLGCLILAFIFCIIYSKWARGMHSASQGAQFGLWLGLLSGVGEGLIDFATANILTLTGTLLNAVIYIIYFLVMGILASMVYGKVKSE